MSDILHRISVAAPPGRVYEAITTSKGLQNWWTRDSKAEPREGSVAEFGFHERAVVFRMRVDKLVPDQRVEWTCLGDDDEWKGTRVIFALEPEEDSTIVHFTHGGWRSVEGAFPSCNAVWGFLMHTLRDHAEGKPARPYFQD